MTSKRITICILVTCFSWTLSVSDIEINGPCKINNLEGTCIPITSCKFAMTILSINDVQTLKSMFCGFEGSHPKVCCPIVKNYQKPTTPKPVQTPPVYDYEVVENEVVTSTPSPPPPPTANPLVLPSRDVCGQVTVYDRIYGGSIADIDEFPWLARIKFFKPASRRVIYACSGTLISDRFVLTAAHCLTVYKVIGVRLGDWDTGTDIDCQDGFCNQAPVDINVDKVIVYPDFDRRNLSNGDIALLRLAEPVKFTEFIKPACLPTTEYVARQDYIDSTFTAVGWGKTEYGEPSELLRKVSLDAVPYSICSSAIPTLPKINDPKVICAGGRKDRDSCQGDSGGPLLRIVRENYRENWFVYGITSHGVKNCGTAGKPAVYTRVSKYMDWILENISNR